MSKLLVLILALIQSLTGLLVPSMLQEAAPGGTTGYGGTGYGAFGQPAEAWTQEFLALNEAIGLPVVTFEHSGGAGEDTHMYDGTSADGAIRLRVNTYPYDERIRSIELWQDIPDGTQAQEEAIVDFLGYAWMCREASMPQGVDQEAMSQDLVGDYEALTGRHANVLEHDGLTAITQVTESLYSEWMPPRYALLIIPSPEVEAVDGRPTYDAFQRDVYIRLNEMGQSRVGWHTVEVNGRASSAYLFNVFAGSFTPMTLLVYTELDAPYALQGVSGRLMEASEDEDVPARLKTYGECVVAVAALLGFDETETLEAVRALDALLLTDTPGEPVEGLPITLTSTDGTASLVLSAEVDTSSGGGLLYMADALVFYHGTALERIMTE